MSIIKHDYDSQWNNCLELSHTRRNVLDYQRPEGMRYPCSDKTLILLTECLRCLYFIVGSDIDASLPHKYSSSCLFSASLALCRGSSVGSWGLLMFLAWMGCVGGISRENSVLVVALCYRRSFVNQFSSCDTNGRWCFSQQNPVSSRLSLQNIAVSLFSFNVLLY